MRRARRGIALVVVGAAALAVLATSGVLAFRRVSQTPVTADQIAHDPAIRLVHPGGYGDPLVKARLQLRLVRKRRNATTAQTASTTPNGQAPARKP